MKEKAQTEKPLSKQLNVTLVATRKRPHAMRMINKKGKWVPHKLTKRNIENILMVLQFLAYKQPKIAFFALNSDKRCKMNLLP